MFKDKIFLLSKDEVEKYLTKIESNTDKHDNHKSGNWWLRAPIQGYNHVSCVQYFCYMYRNGDFRFCNIHSHQLVRPAMYMNLDFLKTLKRTKKGCVHFAEHDWIVLDDETGLLLAKEPVMSLSYDKKSNDYEKSCIRTFLNGFLFELKFLKQEKEVVMDAIIDGEKSYPASSASCMVA